VSAYSHDQLRFHGLYTVASQFSTEQSEALRGNVVATAISGAAFAVDITLTSRRTYYLSHFVGADTLTSGVGVAAVPKRLGCKPT
jgi:uncharacterized membrane protein